MSNLTPYKSRLLDSEHIRVVRVTGGRWQDPIWCELVERKLDDESVKHPYKALSYVWGSSLVTDTILLGGVAFQITLNLSCALRHLRKEDEDVFWWVDALCINQQDRQERSVQVGIMQLIYKYAVEVVVFMGDGVDHRVSRSNMMVPPSSPRITLHGHEQGKSFLAEMLRACRSSSTGKPGPSLTAAACAIVVIFLFSGQDSVEQGCSELVRLNERTRHYLFECLRAYVTCPWWSRIWVVQEIAVGSAITIQYGTITLSWDAMVSSANVWSLPRARHMATNIGIEPENLKVLVLFANQLNGLEQTRRKWRAEGGDDLVRLLQEFSDRHASDDRDKVYGLLSLVKKDQRYIKPNYELDVFETYRSTALALIGKGGSLACWAGDQKRKFNRGLPSWIPDWSTAVDTGDKRRLDLLGSYAANGDWTLRVIEDEREYWDTVKDQMELLVNCRVAQDGRLPASLDPFVHNYIASLQRRARSLGSYIIDADKPQQPCVETISWYSSHGVTLQSAISCLSWCEQNRIYPRSGMGLLQQWIHELENPTLYYRSGNGFGRGTEGSWLIDHELSDLQKAKDEENLDIGLHNARFAINAIESVVLTLYTAPKIRSAIEEVVDRCWKLLDLYKTPENVISRTKLFRVSYSLRGSASWLTEDKYWFPELRFIPMRMPPEDIRHRVLPMQTLRMDVVSWCGTRHFGWAEAESGLTTLILWLYFSSAVVVDRNTEENEVQVNRIRLRQFAKTIVGGMHRSKGSYREADDKVLDTLEDWLRQCLTVDKGGRSGWELTDPEKGGYNVFGQSSWVVANERYGAGWVGDDDRWADAVVPSEGWVRRSLATIGFPVPPSTFLEDIQVATDGRVFFLTQNGSMGLGPASMHNGDEIHILPSGSPHFVLRNRGIPTEQSGTSSHDNCEVVGDCYLHTIDDRRSAEEELVVEGSLPFELLGVSYLDNMLPKRRTVLLV